MGKREKLSMQAFIGGSRRQGMTVENDNTVVQVPLFYLERRMWASVTRHPLQFFNLFFKEGCKNYLKSGLFGGSL